MHPSLLRARAILHRMRWPLAVMAAWFTAAALAFRLLGGLPWHDALLSAFYCEVGSGPFSQGYAFWGQSFVFGVLIALLLRETLENYAERCRLMAKLVTDHTIVVGYTHLGQRLVDQYMEQRKPYVLIERNRDLVDELLRQGEPVIVDDAKSKDALAAANVKAARRLIIATNNLETSLVVTKAAKDANPAIRIAARCPVDGVVEVLEKLGADYVYSTSQAALSEIAKALPD